MRIKRFNLLPCLAIFSMAALVSCSNDETDAIDFVPDSFSINGQKYNTLQEAVQAAAATGDEGTVIKLTSNTSGDGFTVNEGFINIDFGPYTYYLNSGKAITANSSIVAMTGTGGTLKGSGTVIKCVESALDIEGNLNITGDINAKETIYCGFFEDYSGSFSGNISLDDAYMCVKSEKAVLNIGTLDPANSSTLFVESAKNVSIDNVLNGKSTLPVTADVAGIVTVKNGAEVHVHTYGAGEPVSCHDTEHMLKACTACDHFTLFTDENNTKVAACNPYLLEHIKAVEPTETEWGNVEYWQCTVCGNFYADEHAKEGLAPQTIMVAPKNNWSWRSFDFMTNAPLTRSSIKEDEEDDDDLSLEGVIKGVEEVAGVVEGVMKFIEGGPSEEEMFMDMIMGMNQKLDKILANLDVMSAQLNTLSHEVKEATGEAILNPRVEGLKELDLVKGRLDLICKNVLDKYKGKKSLTPDEEAALKKELLPYLYAWNGASENRSRSQLTMNLANSYTKSDRNVDECWRDILHKYVKWEHRNYGARRLAMMNEIAIIEVSALMSSCYIAFAKEYKGADDDEARKPHVNQDLTELINALGNYQKDISDALNVMKDRDSKYRVYYGEKKDIVWNRKFGTYDILGILKEHQSEFFFNYKMHSSDNVEAMSSAVFGFQEAFDEALIKTLMSEYKTNNPFAALDSIGFIRESTDPIFISMQKREHGVNRSGNPREVHCGNWNWASYFEKGLDYLTLDGVLNEHTNNPFIGKSLWIGYRIIDKANIDNNDGSITSMGSSSTPFKFQSVVPAN